ncbi:YlmH/Sll1252 family protein [Jingyaoa shaoxingensis]|uniref:RNA-binding protein n=1 Tax=Jingyaoa shaoxingensis TaxID=2763671 RepID=A0ABR7N902_9FIRM|nr:YlmH/Sll1252 family protein [Jingyaoa shaoxingensis]MBC8572248.1 RNA-binding protein [Jingyaoa shaoxingensis]
MTKDEVLFQRRVIDLANLADRRSMIMFSDFLNLNELNIYHSSKKELAFVTCRLFGGYETAERQMIAFIPDALSYDMEDTETKDGSLPYGWEFPFVCICIRPLHEKYTDKLTHRDFLGAILNIGIERNKIGDILLTDDGTYVFCHETMAELLCRELTHIRHTSVAAQITDLDSFSWQPVYETIHGTVASLRLDSLLSLAFGSSRSSLTSLVENGSIYVNGRLTTSNGYKLKNGDIISARGYGKFQFCSVLSETRKGRLSVEIKRYK